MRTFKSQLASALALVTIATSTLVAADYTLDGGGGTSVSGALELSGTIGQCDSGVMAGGSFELTGGFWVGVNAPPCAPADLNCDGVVDGADLAIVLGSWGPCLGCAADTNDDGVVDGADLALILGSWGS